MTCVIISIIKRSQILTSSRFFFWYVRIKPETEPRNQKGEWEKWIKQKGKKKLKDKDKLKQ